MDERTVRIKVDGENATQAFLITPEMMEHTSEEALKEHIWKIVRFVYQYNKNLQEEEK